MSEDVFFLSLLLSKKKKYIYINNKIELIDFIINQLTPGHAELIIIRIDTK